MPRRKRGRDKRRSDKVRSRKQDLPALNVQAFWKIGDPKPVSLGEGGLVTVTRWEPRIPHYTDRSLEDAVVVSHLLKPRSIKLEDVNLEQLDEPKRVRRRAVRLIRQLDAYNLVLSGSELAEYQKYEGAKSYVKRGGLWYLQLTGLNVEIATFETESQARDWAWEYLGRA